MHCHFCSCCLLCRYALNNDRCTQPTLAFSTWDKGRLRAIASEKVSTSHTLWPAVCAVRFLLLLAHSHPAPPTPIATSGIGVTRSV